jgi:hypothetical protein
MTTTTIVRDPLYRYWNTNQQCPYFKSQGVSTDTLDFRTWTASGIKLESGQIDFGTVFNISPSTFGLTNVIGELTVYFKNDAENYVHILMCIITKVGGTMSSPLVYQSVGNITTTTVTAGSNTTVRIQTSQGVECKWIWRGI